MVKFITSLPILLGATYVSAKVEKPKARCTPGEEGHAYCQSLDTKHKRGNWCIGMDTFSPGQEEPDYYFCDKLAGDYESVMSDTRDNDEIVNSVTGRNGEDASVTAPENRNTYRWCAIPINSVIYHEAPRNQQPIVDKCWHLDSDNPEEQSKMKNSTVGIDKQQCKLRCPDPRMDPYFALKEGKNDYRVFEITCQCQGQAKGPGYCGWKTSGTGIKEFAGGNLMCRYTHFAAKPIFAPIDYPHKNDIEFLGNFAQRTGIKKLNYHFDLNNFKVEYKVQEKYFDAKGKRRVRYIDVDDEHRYFEPKRDRNHDGTWDEGTGVMMFPTDNVYPNDKGTNENQHNKVQKGQNVRAFISCKSHPAGRYFAVIFPACKNKRHVLKKGRPGTCYWQIESVHPNPDASLIDDKKSPLYALGFDPEVPAGKPLKFSKELKRYGLKAKKAEGVISNLMTANKQWRCPDYLENKLN